MQDLYYRGNVDEEASAAIEIETHPFAHNKNQNLILIQWWSTESSNKYSSIDKNIAIKSSKPNLYIVIHDNNNNWKKKYISTKKHHLFSKRTNQVIGI